MASSTQYHNISANDDATFRSHGLAISTGLQAVATKLSAGDSSGQINWATVSRPSTSDTVAGYELYRFSDSLQSSYPVFIKVEYGTGTIGVSSYNLAIWLTVGFAHNGSGTLTGFTTVQQKFTTSQNFALACYCTSIFGGASNRLSVRLRSSPTIAGTNQPFDIIIERTHAADGSDTNYGVIVLTGNGGSAWKLVLITFSVGILVTDTNLSVLPPTVGHGSTGMVTAMYPVWAYAGPYLCQVGGVVFAFPGNITNGVSFTLTLLGTANVYLPLQSGSDNGLTGRNSITLSPCFRYD